LKHAPTPKRAPKVFDTIVVGGGPAGLSAAIYLARYNRTVLVIDAGEGRSTSHETNENYLGFPGGIPSRELRARGCKQAKRFGAEFVAGCVTSVRSDNPGFVVRAGRRVFRSRTMIVATGVVDRFPAIDEIEKYVGKSLFWCITCDGWKTRGKRIVVVGNTDEAATTALQFLNFTGRVTMLTNEDRIRISAKKQRDLANAKIAVIGGKVKSIVAQGDKMQALETTNGNELRFDMMFSSLGSDPHIELARKLRLTLEAGYIKTDLEQRTSRTRIYAAGDVTKAFAHQIATAVHEGATAAQSANHDLYERAQRE
jgi:thioredoxin reductase (NADPH)